jgi:hypothetical protein
MVTGDHSKEPSMAEMTEQVSVMLPPDQAKWLRDEAKRIERPISFVMRKLLLREQLNRNVDAADSITDVTCRMPAADEAA